MLEILLSKEVLIGLSVFSVVCFVGSLITIPFILVRLPANYFEESYPRSWFRNHHPVLRVLAHLIKNMVGLVFVLAGIAMLVLPGQGILTILIGISFLDFPGKRRLEAKLVGQPPVFRAINNMREKFGHPPLTLTPNPVGGLASSVRRQPSASAE